MIEEPDHQVSFKRHLSPEARPAAPDVLIHLHIAKTGGTSLSSMIKHGFRSEEIAEVSIGTPGGLRQAPHEECKRELVPLKHIRYVSGHVPLGIHRIFERPAKYIATVRQPIERIVSFFFFQAEDDGHYMKDGRPLTFVEYVEACSDIQLHNYQVRVLCGTSDLEAETPGREQHNPRIRVERHHLEQAKKNVEQLFLAIAPVEQLAELGLLIRLVYGWPLRRLFTEYKNATKSRPRVSELSSRTTRILEECNSYDMELYEWVRQRFAAERKLFEPELSRDRRVYRVVNRALNLSGEILPWNVRKSLAAMMFYAR